MASLSTKINLPKNYQLRIIAGTAPKLPDFEQLFTYMVDSNHNVQGKPEPETVNRYFFT